ncbi:putative gastrointestinal growth factor xP4 [Ptychodera flava]|uniref:putative gastrointestinal growth factor xP4 n=1 Tax=Ptychodera flava TaxID=63121 RepID=UPI00396A476D
MMVTFEGQVPNLFSVLAMNLILMTCGDQTCDLVDPPNDRLKCNHDGGAAEECEKIKCCFKEEGSVWCSFPEPCSIAKTDRISCYYSGSPEDCLDRGCCFFADKDNKDGGDECFLSNTCAQVPVGDRIDCVHTSPADCLDAGCCYDTSCFLTEGCADDTFYRDGDCLQCNCQSVCDKNTGSCGTRCNHGFISEDCQEAQTPIVDEFSQSNKEILVSRPLLYAMSQLTKQICK